MKGEDVRSDASLHLDYCFSSHYKKSEEAAIKRFRKRTEVNSKDKTNSPNVNIFQDFSKYKIQERIDDETLYISTMLSVIK